MNPTPKQMRELKNKYDFKIAGRVVKVIDLKIGDTLLWRHFNQTIKSSTDHGRYLNLTTNLGERRLFKASFVYIKS